MNRDPFQNWPANAPRCDVYWSWWRSVKEGRWRACLHCYCLRKCGCKATTAYHFVAGRCENCGARRLEVFPQRAPVASTAGTSSPAVSPASLPDQTRAA